MNEREAKSEASLQAKQEASKENKNSSESCVIEAAAAAAANTPNKSQKHPILARLEENDYDFNGQSLDYEPNLEFDDTDLREDLEVELEEMGAKLLLMQLNNQHHHHHHLSSAKGKNQQGALLIDNNDSESRNHLGDNNRDKLVYSSTSQTSSASSELLAAPNNQQPQPSCSSSELGASPATTNAVSPDHVRTNDNLEDLQLDESAFTADELLEHAQICDQMYRYDAFLESPHHLLEENFEEAFQSSLFELTNNATNSANSVADTKLQQNQRPVLPLKRRRKSKKNLSDKSKSSKSRSNNKLNIFNNANEQELKNKQSATNNTQMSKLGARTARTGQRLNAFLKSATGAIYNGFHLSTSSSSSSSNNNDNNNNNNNKRQNHSTWNQQSQLINSQVNMRRLDHDDQDDQDEEDYEEDEDDLELLFDGDDFLHDDYSDIARHNCVEVAGDDKLGRRIITIYACRLPSDSNRLHHVRLLKYIMFTLNQFVDNDYVLVYFHFGLNSRNKPKLSFLYQAYRAFDRRYKKNLKALYLVQPTNFIRIVWQLFKPIISIKFGRKMRYVNYLHELEQFMHLEQLLIPKPVIE